MAFTDRQKQAFNELFTRLKSICGFRGESLPEDIYTEIGQSGGSSVGSNTPLPVAGSASVGVSALSSREDHVHAHGNQAGGSLHAAATGDTPGFYDVNAAYALQFDDGTNKKLNITLGRYFHTGVNLPSKWFYDGWTCPNEAASTYWLIESATGAHALELGFSQAVAGSKNTPFGFIYDGSGNTVHGADEGAFNNEWIHYAVGSDGSWIYDWVNGILCGMVPWSGIRRTSPGDFSSNGTLILGCTDHNNFRGKLGGYVRGWEGHFPFVNPHAAFTPERFATTQSWDFASRFTPCNLLIDLCNPIGTYLPDLSPIGYNGFAPLNTPSAPTISPQGVTGATSYSYKVAALYGHYSTDASTAGSTATGNATLNGSNFNRITWTIDPRATGYAIYRTAGGATQGQIGTVAANVGTFDDTGITAISLNVPASNLTSAGRTHSGTYWGSENGDNDGFPQAPLMTYPVPNWIIDPTAPFTKNTAPPAQTIFVPAPTAIPVGARIYDDFERADSTPAFQSSPTLGSTRSGTVRGALAYTTGKFPGNGGASTIWGILHGKGRWCHNGNPVASYAIVDNAQADMDVQVDRFVGTYNVGTVGTPVTYPSTGVIFRFVDGNNFFCATVTGDPRNAVIYIVTIVGGAYVTLTGEPDGSGYTRVTISNDVNWTRLRVTCVGNTITVYTGVTSGTFDANGFPNYTWTQRLQRTTAQNNTGTKVGLGLCDGVVLNNVSSIATWNNFAVF